MVGNLDAFMNKLKTVGMSRVTENMKKFIIQLRDYFYARFDDF